MHDDGSRGLDQSMFFAHGFDGYDQSYYKYLMSTAMQQVDGSTPGVVRRGMATKVCGNTVVSTMPLSLGRFMRESASAVCLPKQRSVRTICRANACMAMSASTLTLIVTCEPYLISARHLYVKHS